MEQGNIKGKRKRLLQAALLLLACAAFACFACSCGQQQKEEVKSPDLKYYDTGYGTYFVCGTRIDHPADQSTSIVVDWNKEPAAKVPEDVQFKEVKHIVYQHSKVTDGKEAGQPLDLNLNLMLPEVLDGDEAAGGKAEDAAKESGDAAGAKAEDAGEAADVDEAGDIEAKGESENTGTKTSTEELRPVILLTPGGGFITCRIDGKYTEVQRYLAAHGYAVAMMEYHRIGQGRYFDAAKDVWAAMEWIKEHGEEYGLDADRIALMGNSAGGYVAALAACQGVSGGEDENADADGEGENADADGEGENADADVGEGENADADVGEGGSETGTNRDEDGMPPIRCVVNFYGLSDILNNKADYEDAAIEAQHEPPSSDSQFVNGVLSGKGLTDDLEEAAKADPVTYIDGDEPPFLHMHGDADLWVSPSQSVHLHDALQAAGVESTRYCAVGAAHGDKAFRTKAALDLVLEFLDRYCGEAE